jgi:hypothetical protein
MLSVQFAAFYVLSSVSHPVFIYFSAVAFYIAIIYINFLSRTSRVFKGKNVNRKRKEGERGKVWIDFLLVGQLKTTFCGRMIPSWVIRPTEKFPSGAL